MIHFDVLTIKTCGTDTLHKKALYHLLKRLSLTEKKADEHYRQMVEIFYNCIESIDRPIWANESEAADDEKPNNTPDSEPCASIENSLWKSW